MRWDVAKLIRLVKYSWTACHSSSSLSPSSKLTPAPLYLCMSLSSSRVFHAPLSFAPSLLPSSLLSFSVSSVSFFLFISGLTLWRRRVQWPPKRKVHAATIASKELSCPSSPIGLEFCMWLRICARVVDECIMSNEALDDWRDWFECNVNRKDVSWFVEENKHVRKFFSDQNSTQEFGDAAKLIFTSFGLRPGRDLSLIKFIQVWQGFRGQDSVRDWVSVTGDKICGRSARLARSSRTRTESPRRWSYVWDFGSFPRAEIQFATYNEEI